MIIIIEIIIMKSVASYYVTEFDAVAITDGCNLFDEF